MPPPYECVSTFCLQPWLRRRALSRLMFAQACSLYDMIKSTVTYQESHMLPCSFKHASFVKRLHLGEKLEDQKQNSQSEGPLYQVLQAHMGAPTLVHMQGGLSSCQMCRTQRTLLPWSGCWKKRVGSSGF